MWVEGGEGVLEAFGSVHVYMLIEYGSITVIDYGTLKAFIRKIKAIE